jgi:hypothetical protein
LSSRKLILIVDDSEDSLIAKELFSRKKVEYVQYHASKFEANCYGSATNGTGSSRLLTAPTVFAPEGVFKGLENLKSYFDMEVRDYESESAYWK